MKINYQQARDFLEKINERDNVMIFTHKDLDGFASGILLLDYCKKKGAKADVRIIDYGVSRISDFSVEEFNKVLLSDLAPGSVWEDLRKLEGKEIFYTDHHQSEKESPIPDFVLEFRTTEEGYIPSSRTCFELCGGKRWLSVLGVLSDMGQVHQVNASFLEEFYKEQHLTEKEVEKELHKLSDVIIFFSASLDSFYKLAELEKMEDISTLEEYYTPVMREFSRIEDDFNKNKKEFGEVTYYYLESQFSLIKSAVITYISTKEPNKIYFFASRKKGSLISLSSRNQSREYDVSQIMKSCTNGLKEGTGGGHKAAAGGQVDESDLEKFKERLKQINIEDYGA